MFSHVNLVPQRATGMNPLVTMLSLGNRSYTSVTHPPLVSMPSLENGSKGSRVLVIQLFLCVFKT